MSDHKNPQQPLKPQPAKAKQHEESWLESMAHLAVDTWEHPDIALGKMIDGAKALKKSVVAGVGTAEVAVREYQKSAEKSFSGFKTSAKHTVDRVTDYIAENPDKAASNIILSPLILLGALTSCSKKKGEIDPITMPEVLPEKGNVNGKIGVHYGPVDGSVVAKLNGFQLSIVEPGHTPPGQVKNGYAYVSVGGLNTHNGDPELIELNAKLTAIKPDKDGHSGFLTKADGSVQTRPFDASNAIKMYDLRNKEAYGLVSGFIKKHINDYGGVFLDELDYVAAAEVISNQATDKEKGRYNGIPDAMGNLLKDVAGSAPGKVILNGGVQERESGKKQITQMMAEVPVIYAKESLLGWRSAQGVVKWSKDDADWVDARMTAVFSDAKAAGKTSVPLLGIEPWGGNDMGSLKATATEYGAKIDQLRTRVPGLEVNMYSYFSDMTFNNPTQLDQNAALAGYKGGRLAADQTISAATNTTTGGHIASRLALATGNPEFSVASRLMVKPTGKAQDETDALFTYINSQPGLANNPELRKQIVHEAAALVGKYKIGRDANGHDVSGGQVNQKDGKLDEKELAATIGELNSKFKGQGVSLSASGVQAVVANTGGKGQAR